MAEVGRVTCGHEQWHDRSRTCYLRAWAMTWQQDDVLPAGISNDMTVVGRVTCGGQQEARRGGPVAGAGRVVDEQSPDAATLGQSHHSAATLHRPRQYLLVHVLSTHNTYCQHTTRTVNTWTRTGLTRTRTGHTWHVLAIHGSVNIRSRSVSIGHVQPMHDLNA